jgi:hypothetical protein
MKINYCGYALIALLFYICLKIYQESDMFNLKCIISGVDGKKYCVRERQKLELAADRLANVNEKMNKLVVHCFKKYPDRENVQRLKNGYNPKKIMETLPTSEYTAYSQNKGEKMAFCLNKEKDGNQLIEPNTLCFVALHELSHIATKSIGHKDEFWNNFKFILTEASKIGIYEQVDYKKKPARYCGTDINDNPFFDL